MRFFDRIQDKYRLVAEDGPNSIDLSPGSSSPENWQTTLQTGYNAEEIREKAKALHDILKCIENTSLEAWDIFSMLSDGGGKHLEMNSPILIKGLSKQKLLNVAIILETCAEYALIK